MNIKNKFKKISLKSLIFILGIIIGTSVSIVYAYSWRGTSKINSAISQNRVLKPDEIREIRDNIEYLKNKINSWPPGHYCILENGNCPSGFRSGYICFDTEDDRNGDSKYGYTGSSRTPACGMSGVKLYFCCK